MHLFETVIKVGHLAPYTLR